MENHIDNIPPAFDNRDWKQLRTYEKITVVVGFIPAMIFLAWMELAVWFHIRLRVGPVPRPEEGIE